ncbi:hypothetical protein G6F51_014346 [Rhizopus arrhizus]|uniref:Uncharacterized protein n=1 Tax=Rhizopus oryzae TaxID=64495 RepID=A0A9P6XM94_RHIOR|nr:hypothetical protein G6F51_014346 [Rhizopus arrhizus]
MNGAFAMTEVPEITAVTGGAESYIKRALAADVVPGRAAADCPAGSTGAAPAGAGRRTAGSALADGRAGRRRRRSGAGGRSSV